MANIPIRDIPGAVVASPDPSNLIPMDNGSLMQKTTIANAVNTTLPLSSQVEAEAGADNVKRMSPLRTKQAIDAQTPSIVNTAITSLNLGTMSQEDASDYTPTSGLAAVALSNDYGDLSNLPTLGTMSQETASDYTKTSGLAAVALSNDYNDLDNLPTLGSAAATDASDYATAAQGSLADTAVQPGDSALVPAGGTIGQVLVKNSGTNYDTGWVSSAAATAVSYAPQTLTDAQTGQARANIDAGILAGFRNKIINGRFDFWQRGTAVSVGSAATGYTADRWRVQTTSGLSCSASRLAAAVGYVGGKYYGQFAFSGTGAAGSTIRQPIEDVWTLQGKTATLTFSHGALAGQNVNVYLRQNFGTGGSPSTPVVTATQVVAFPSGLSGRASLTFAVPSISGKTIGTNGDDCLEVVFEITQANAQTLYLADVSLVEGDATAEGDPFSPRHIQQELALCQRYYESSGGFDTALISCNVTAGGTYLSTTIYAVRKRATPAVAIANGVATNFPNAVSLGNYPHAFVMSAVANGTGAGLLSYSFTSDAEL